MLQTKKLLFNAHNYPASDTRITSCSMRLCNTFLLACRFCMCLRLCLCRCVFTSPYSWNNSFSLSPGCPPTHPLILSSYRTNEIYLFFSLSILLFTFFCSVRFSECFSTIEIIEYGWLPNRNRTMLSKSIKKAEANHNCEQYCCMCRNNITSIDLLAHTDYVDDNNNQSQIHATPTIFSTILHYFIVRCDQVRDIRSE